MNREEQIRMASMIKYPYDTDIDLANGFKEGAKWADEHPTNKWRTDLVPDFYGNILMKLDKDGKQIITLGYIANGVIFSENQDLNIEKNDIIAWMPIN